MNKNYSDLLFIHRLVSGITFLLFMQIQLKYNRCYIMGITECSTVEINITGLKLKYNTLLKFVKVIQNSGGYVATSLIISRLTDAHVTNRTSMKETIMYINGNIKILQFALFGLRAHLFALKYLY